VPVGCVEGTPLCRYIDALSTQRIPARREELNLICDTNTELRVIFKQLHSVSSFGRCFA
jgi:hypothetical protein